MTSARSSYFRLTVVLAVLAIVPISAIRSSTATNSPSPSLNTFPGADLANEERVLAKYFDDLVTYDKQVAEVSKRTAFVSADLDPLQRKADDLKGRLTVVQNSVREIVRKLKAANEWEDLDTSIAAKITDTSQRSFLLESSFKHLLEESSNNLTTYSTDIKLPLDNLRKRLASRQSEGSDFDIVRAGYEAPTPFLLSGLQCRTGTIRVNVTIKLGGFPSKDTLNNVFANCNPGRIVPW
ncbi:MAG: hypothetical protein DMF69_08970 [Acidobacteria bacterium]|nr:MAG: hypothetical protein DMF69_08970 [Acidobacteriota bacterium]